MPQPIGWRLLALKSPVSEVASNFAAGFATPLQLERIAIDTAIAASKLVATGLGEATTLGAKSSPTDIVTNIDIASETLIRTLLTAAVPQSGVIGEEQGSGAGSERLQWVVDPLDGTINFLYGLPIFAISIGAAIDGEVVAGAVVDCVRGDVFSAAIGHGARRNDLSIQVTGCTELCSALITTGFSYQPELRAQQGDIIRALLPLCRDIRCFGSAALQLCWVGAGWLDGYFERDTKLWDFTAGALIAHEAGASIEMPCPENDGLMMATTPAIFAQLRPILEPSGR